MTIKESEALEFKRLCEFVAISDAVDNVEVLMRLIETTLLDSNLIGLNSVEILAILASKYSVPENIDSIDKHLSSLVKAKRIEENSSRYRICESRHFELSKALQDVTTLEREVKDTWHKEVEGKFGEFDLELLWTGLTEFIAQAIRLHGLETISLLHPSSIINGELHKPLQAIVQECAKKYSIPQEEEILVQSIQDFFAGTQINANRAKLISQLSSSAFNYYSLRIPPEVSVKLKTSLSPLTVFLDTNFIFCLLGLDSPDKVSSAQELIRLIQTNNLPFKICYHVATADEVTRTLAAKKDYLQRRQWSKSISAAAISTASVGGVDIGYHTANSISPITPEYYFLALEDFRNTLKEKGIKIYNCQNELFEKRGTLESSYRRFLESYPLYRGRMEREDSAINHDCHLLASIYHLRSEASSILDTKSLLLSVDYKLYRWESRRARRSRKSNAIILPHQLFQLLKPFCESHDNYDANFVNAISIPDFRIVRNINSSAQSQAVSLLGSFDKMNERQATTILSNKILVDRIGDASSDEDKIELIQLELSESEEAARRSAAKMKVEAKKSKDALDKSNKEVSTLKKELTNSKVELTNSKVELSNSEVELTKSTPKSEAEKRESNLHLTIRTLISLFVLYLLAAHWDAIIDELNLRDSWIKNYSYRFHICLWATAITASLTFIFLKHWKFTVPIAVTTALGTIALMSI